MVDVYRRNLEQMYDCTCTIETEVDEIDSNTGIVSKQSKIDGPYPCRISFKTSNIGNSSEMAKFSQLTTLFISPNVFIPKGARIALTGRKTKQFFRSASISATYDTHQEVQLENLEVH